MVLEEREFDSFADAASTFIRRGFILTADNRLRRNGFEVVIMSTDTGRFKSYVEQLECRQVPNKHLNPVPAINAGEEFTQKAAHL